MKRRIIAAVRPVIFGLSIMAAAWSCATPGTEVSPDAGAVTDDPRSTAEVSPIWIDDENGSTYTPLGILFPARYEEFTIGEKTMFDDAGLDVSVGYNSDVLPMWMTVYVYLKEYYPSPDPLTHFEGLVSDVFSSFPGSKLLSANELDFQFGGAPVDGYIGFFKYAEGPTPGDWGGIAVLYPYGDFYVYLRASFLGVDDQAVRDGAWLIVDQFFVRLDLPAPRDN